MKRIDFFSLLRPVEERFVDAARGQGVPAPLLVAKEPLPFAALRWGALGVLLLALWAWVSTLGYGKLESSIALQPVSLLVLHLLLPAGAVLAGFRARSCLRARLRLPFTPTVYLFPIGVIDARTQSLAIHGWDELTSKNISASRARLVFREGRFDFPIANAEQGRELERRVTELSEQVASGKLSEHDLVLLDPLRDNGFRNPFSPTESMLPPKPPKIPLVPIAAALGAALLGYGVWAARNSLGERALFERAHQLDTVTAYKEYLARGGKRTEVVDLLLPRAELRTAVAENSVEGIERYSASHPNTKIAGEVQSALRAALLRDLETAKAKNSITALREYETRHKAHLELVPELAQARYAYLSGVLERYHRDHKPSRELWQLARRLIVYADKHGPEIEIRFSQRESRTLEKNERMLMASAYYGGEKTLPSRYLVGPPVRKAEERAAKEFIAQFSKLFPEDLLHFKQGAPVDAAAEKPKFDKPTLFVGFRLEISSTFVSKRPRAIFTGVGLIAETSLNLPDKEPPHEFKHTAWHIPDIRRIEAESIPADTVYPELVAKAFTRLVTKYTNPWLGKD
ncbi:MAG TPA: hypothetical protein VGK73_06510 [Polyangiaceae bacterium]